MPLVIGDIEATSQYTEKNWWWYSRNGIGSSGVWGVWGVGEKLKNI